MVVVRASGRDAAEILVRNEGTHLFRYTDSEVQCKELPDTGQKVDLEE